MLGAAHSAANPLTAHFGTVHGEAVGMMLPHVVRFNAGKTVAAEEYSLLAAAAGAADLADFLASLLDSAGMPARIEGGALTDENIPHLADEAAAQWTAQFNPRPVSAGDFAALYARVK